MRLVCALLVLGCSLGALSTANQILDIKEGPYVHYSGRALVNLGGRNYFFDTSSPSKWSEAKNFCRSIGMFLVSVETPEENQLLVDYMTSTAGLHNYWMSGNDHGRNRGDWVWDSTGQPVIYTNFHAGEPNLKNGEHCLMWWFRDGLLKWNDAPDDMGSVYPICEQA